LGIDLLGFLLDPVGQRLRAHQSAPRSAFHYGHHGIITGTGATEQAKRFQAKANGLLLGLAQIRGRMVLLIQKLLFEQGKLTV
jgi:hypothetical protein